MNMFREGQKLVKVSALFYVYKKSIPNLTKEKKSVILFDMKNLLKKHKRLQKAIVYALFSVNAS